MTKRDFYEILGVERNASQDQIKRAFRSKARHLHPDNMESGDEAAFKELASAYEVLSDEQKRSLYDRYGHDGLSGGAGGFEGVDFGAFSDLSEIFSQFFGGGGPRAGFRRATVERGADLKYDLQLDFLEAVFGVEKKIQIPHLEDCTVCSGNGAAPGSGPVKCTTCAGAGQIKQTTSTFLGHFTQVLTCPNCNGEGTRIEKACANCKGRGQVRKSREIELKVPAGIDSSARLRIPNAGDQGRRGGPPGDVYVIIHILEHPAFMREGATIHLKQSLSFSMAALGGQLTVPTVAGEKILKIQPGTQSGASIIMRGEGVPHLNNPAHRGDQVVHLQVETPTKLTAEEKALLVRLSELRGEKLTGDRRESLNYGNLSDNGNLKEKTGKEEKTGKRAAGNNRQRGTSKKSKEQIDKDGNSIMDKLADFFGAREPSNES